MLGMLKEMKGVITVRVLKQRAPKTEGDTGGDQDEIINHLISPKLLINWKEKDAEYNCDGDMKDDAGSAIPFCGDTFRFNVLDGRDLAKYVTFTVNDRDLEVGKLRLKMQTLINGGDPTLFDVKKNPK